jgi:hypothetical protein
MGELEILNNSRLAGSSSTVEAGIRYHQGRAWPHYGRIGLLGAVSNRRKGHRGGRWGSMTRALKIDPVRQNFQV